MSDQREKGLSRRALLKGFAATATLPMISGCSQDEQSSRLSQADIDALAEQRAEEARLTGKGPYGQQRYEGYRGLSELPWFELDNNMQLVCVDDSIPLGIDVHTHLGMSYLFAPDIDLTHSPTRVKHLLDSDGDGTTIDLDVYANANFSEAQLKVLQRNTIAQGLWGSSFAKTQTIPALVQEMSAMRIGHSVLLPIKTGLPFGDDLTERWRNAIQATNTRQSLTAGASVYPWDEDSVPELKAHLAAGAKVIKLHPTVQSFYPDDTRLMPLYEELERAGAVLFFHGGRAGIEPDSRQPYAVPLHYEAVLADFPKLQVVMGHAGARDQAAMTELATRYDNAWLGIHGQGVSRLEDIINRTGGERLLFGSDWPFYHIGMSLAKVLICTRDASRQGIRKKILQDNALQLMPQLRDSVN
ncbi:amidohydrolase family protein [Parahalioglobus pacificus]|uniref:Amidohydrolase-related domain-containing protein n=1 Tax=Parahalioglobus pacificus TaxID=930806 RepID=A0A918XJW0_9GAMM|nr:amidohydrolase family protein [Halioglobus pacificus]GHD34264.1 hypothetical protein GCM10007053_19710 [Halioglobus pacificus]